MAEQKKEVKATKTKIILPEKAKYISTKGCNLPVAYKGSVLHINDKDAVELELRNLSYEMKIEIKRAIKLNNLIIK